MKLAQSPFGRPEWYIVSMTTQGQRILDRVPNQPLRRRILSTIIFGSPAVDVAANLASSQILTTYKLVALY